VKLRFRPNIRNDRTHTDSGEIDYCEEHVVQNHRRVSYGENEEGNVPGGILGFPSEIDDNVGSPDGPSIMIPLSEKYLKTT
jgi:hypothetical protein